MPRALTNEQLREEPVEVKHLDQDDRVLDLTETNALLMTLIQEIRALRIAFGETFSSAHALED